jgi:hypothetical protein
MSVTIRVYGSFDRKTEIVKRTLDEATRYARDTTFMCDILRDGHIIGQKRVGMHRIDWIEKGEK